MVNLLDSVRSQCPEVDPALVDRHFRCLPATYFERYAPADIARHLRLLSKMTAEQPVGVEVRPLAARAFEVLVVGEDYSGTVACITTALACYRFDLEDVQIAYYLEAEGGPTPLFVILLRISGNLRGRSLADLAAELRGRLCRVFRHLAEGNFLEAQAVAADSRIGGMHDEYATPRQHGTNSTRRPDAYVGLVLGNDFCLQRKLASGGMSEIYLANQVSLNRTVAVKLFHHQAAADDELLARFHREALVLARFSCASIVPILAAGTVTEPAGGSLGWMAMEYMAGGDLARWQRQFGCPPADRAVRWFRQALEGLYYAHRRSILHRDLKPHNLLLTAEGDLKVSDFGLLKQARQQPSHLTGEAVILGTPHYMSPEQALGEPLDERSDIFSLGTTFFHLLSGRVPFHKDSVTALLVQIAHEDAPRLAAVAPTVPLPLAVLIQRMMARLRDERYQDVCVILEDLASYERRGLLTFSDSGSFLPAQPFDGPGLVAESTHAFPPPGDASKARV